MAPPQPPPSPAHLLPLIPHDLPFTFSRGRVASKRLPGSESSIILKSVDALGAFRGGRFSRSDCKCSTPSNRDFGDRSRQRRAASRNPQHTGLQVGNGLADAAGVPKACFYWVIVSPTGTECARLMYLGNPHKKGKSRKPCWQCRETVAVWTQENRSQDLSSVPNTLQSRPIENQPSQDRS